MAQMTVDKGYFSTHAEVMADIAKTGFWPTTYVSDPSPELPLHHHEEDIIGYLLEGSSYVLGEEGERIELEPGDRLVLPKGSTHAEGAVFDRMVYVVTIRNPIPFIDALAAFDLDGRALELMALD
tara:strand:+ start:593 stop:967 length:375 start_codon:yes stop_codon:yes gene_type:complete